MDFINSAALLGLLTDAMFPMQNIDYEKKKQP